MTEFLAAALQFPTGVFTVMLLAFLAYALLMAAGIVGLDSLDSMFGIDPADGINNPFEDALDAIGVQGIPMTIFGGVALVFAWLGSYMGMYFLGDALGGAALSTLLGLGCAVGGGAIGAFAVRPLRPFFTTVSAPGRRSLIGKTCTIRSLRVDEKLGTAEVDDGAAGYIAEVRCLRENTLTRGQQALVYSYDEQDGTYHVVPLDLPQLEEQGATHSAIRGAQHE